MVHDRMEGNLLGKYISKNKKFSCKIGCIICYTINEQFFLNSTKPKYCAACSTRLAVLLT